MRFRLSAEVRNVGFPGYGVANKDADQCFYYCASSLSLFLWFLTNEKKYPTNPWTPTGASDIAHEDE